MFQGNIGKTGDMERKVEEKFQKGGRENSTMSNPVKELRSDH